MTMMRLTHTSAYDLLHDIPSYEIAKWMRMSKRENELRDQLELRRRRFQRRKSHFEEGKVIDEKVPLVHNILAMNAFSIGVYLLLLNDDTETAYAWLSDATEYYLKRVRTARERYDLLERSYQENEPLMLEKTIATAICAQDEALIHETVTEADAINPAYPEEFPNNVPRYHYVQALAALIRDDDATAQECLSQLQGTLDVMSDGVDAWYEAHALILEGILEQDHGRARTGLMQLVEIHETHFQSPRSGDEWICRPAVALMLVAHDRGFDIEFESEYVPERMVA